jgi:hypothetical protein
MVISPCKQALIKKIESPAEKVLQGFFLNLSFLDTLFSLTSTSFILAEYNKKGAADHSGTIVVIFFIQL